MPFTPLHSLLGGLMMSVAVSGMAEVLGQVLGISGFFRQTLTSVLRPPSPPATEKTNTKRFKRTKQQQSASQSVSTARFFTLGLLLAGLGIGYTCSPLERALGMHLFDRPDVHPNTFAADTSIRSWHSWTATMLCGLLIGAGTEWGKGCTSGHFLCGLSRLSPRSIVATATFFSVAVATHLLTTSPGFNFLTARFSSSSVGSEATAVAQATAAAAAATVTPYIESLPGSKIERIHSPSWMALLLLQLPVVAYTALPRIVRGKGQARKEGFVANLSALALGVHFAFGLALTGMLRPSKVLGFLSLSPFRVRQGEWDPSLAFVAIGGILPSMAYYKGRIQEAVLRQQQQLLRQLSASPSRSATAEAPGAAAAVSDTAAVRPYKPPSPILGEACPLWRIPTSRTIDKGLVLGAALFGVGWGLTGSCPGPMLVTFGAALVSGRLSLAREGAMFVGLAMGGQLAELTRW